MRIRLLLAALTAACCGMAEDPRAAVVFSDWGNRAFANEFDDHLKAAEIGFDKFENIRLPELTEKLDGYGLVVATSLANYTKTVKMSPYASKWCDWINRGGALLVVDANYSSVLNQWVSALNPDFRSECENCSAHTKKTPESKVVTVKEDPLLCFPQSLGDLIKKHYTQWTHLNRLGPEWHTPITCADGKPLFAYLDYGKGSIVLTTAASLKNNPIGGALLTNVLTRLRLQAAGIKIKQFQTGDQPGNAVQKQIRLRLEADPARYRNLTAKFEASNNSRAGTASNAQGSSTVTVPENGETEFSFTYTVSRRGTVTTKFCVFSDDQPLVNFSLIDTEPDALAIKTKRKHLYPGDMPVAVAKLHPNPLGIDRLESIEWQLDNGPWSKRNAEEREWTVPGKPLTEGRHVLRARLKYAPKFIKQLTTEQRSCLDWGENAETEFFVHPAAKYQMRKDHVLLENGQPFFPLGFYQVSWSTGNEHRLAIVRDIAAWGYNTVHASIRNNELGKDSYGEFLDECAQVGVRVITEFAGDPKPVIERYKNRTAVMGWNPGDEPAPKGITPEEMFRRYDSFKRLDPDHIAYTVICVPSQYANYAAGTDVLAPDPYPVPKTPVDNVYRLFKEAKQAANRTDTALWAVCQAFGGQKYVKTSGWSRSPTPQEFRAMSYLAIMAGAKGIIYYTFYDDSYNLLQDPELLAAAKVFPAEIKEITPFVLDGKAEMLAENRNGVYAMRWKLGKRERLVAVNATKEKVETDLVFAKAKLLFGEPEYLKEENGKMRLILPPLERAVLELQ